MESLRNNRKYNEDSKKRKLGIYEEKHENEKREERIHKEKIEQEKKISQIDSAHKETEAKIASYKKFLANFDLLVLKRGFPTLGGLRSEYIVTALEREDIMKDIIKGKEDLIDKYDAILNS